MEQVYLQPFEQYFWKLADNHEVIEIRNGNTIVYTQSLFQDIFPVMAMNGLPPAGTLLMALVALNPHAQQDIQHIFQQVENYFSKKQLDGSYGEDIFHKSRQLLINLSTLPNQYKTRQNKVILLATLFEQAHNRIARSSSNALLHDYEQGYMNTIFKEERPLLTGQFVKDFRPLALLHEKYNSTERLIEMMGNVSLHDEAIIMPELPNQSGDVKQEKDFVDKLTEHISTFTVGSLIRHIWTGLHIPFHFHLPGEQPLGGVADLTNKGSFDRLLISEFANEDLVFLSRIANNEALYIQREVPPQTNEKQRYILIDTSIKNWGTPKTLAVALAIAIARHPKNNIVTRLYTIGTDYKEMYYQTVDHVITCMQATSPSLHAAKGLSDFMQDYQPGKQQEVIIISSKEASMSRPFQHVTHEHFSSIRYWLDCSRDGAVDVFANQHQAKKHMQHFKLPLQEAWIRKQNPVQAVTTGIPNVLAVSDYELLFATEQGVTKFYHTTEGSFIADKRGNLFKYPINNATQYHDKGWELIYTKLPLNTSKHSLVGTMKTGDIVWLNIPLDANEDIVYINVSKKTEARLTNHDIAFKHISAVDFIQDVFYISLYYNKTNYRISPTVDD